MGPWPTVGVDRAAADRWPAQLGTLSSIYSTFVKTVFRTSHRTIALHVRNSSEHLTWGPGPQWASTAWQQTHWPVQGSVPAAKSLHWGQGSSHWCCGTTCRLSPHYCPTPDPPCRTGVASRGDSRPLLPPACIGQSRWCCVCRAKWPQGVSQGQ